MKPILEVHNLSKQYGTFKAVDDVSFKINSKEIFALIGPNGAGKSTTLKIVSTILQPTSGSIYIDGLSITEKPEIARQHISYLAEEAGAYKNLTGLAYLHFMAGLFYEDSHQINEAVEFAKSITGLGNRLKDKLQSYSKGMTRKLLLARTIMTKPRLAILDEPTSGLDIINAVTIRETIRNIVNQNETAVLLSSHNMLEIEYLSDRVGIINKGIIHEIGTPQELKKKYECNNLEEVFVRATK